MVSKRKEITTRLIRLKDAAHILGVPLGIMPKLIRVIGCPTLRDNLGVPCISFEDFAGLHENPIVMETANVAFRNESERRIADSASGADKHLEREIRTKLTEYRSYVALLEELHSKYLARIGPVREPSALRAAYLLYARVINLLNMGCVCLEAGYWNAGLVLRQIDEAVQVAEYFSTCEPTPQLRRAVLRWFRENRTPRPADIRRAIADRAIAEIGEEEAKRHLSTMDELYELKSKWVHPAFSPIRETFRTFPIEGTAAVVGFDYGPCSYPRKLHELTLFYRSSIWTAAQGFILCFERQMPLDPEDAARLHGLDRKFNDEPDGL